MLIPEVSQEVDLLRKASTHARISVCRWSADVLDGDDAKLDGVSTMRPEARPMQRSQDEIVNRRWTANLLNRDHAAL
jgi:hypothetical protein